MKIPVRGYILIDPTSPYPVSHKSTFYIGGVAKSAASEQASEDGCLMVEVTGYYEKSELESLLQDRIECYEEYVKSARSDKERKDSQGILESYQKSLKELQEKNKIEDFANAAHFSKEELESLKVK